MRHVILDTDIGRDVNDLLALVFLAPARELARPRNGSHQRPSAESAADPIRGTCPIACRHQATSQGGAAVQSFAPSALDALGYLFLGLASST
jgi:hypothetical protein